MHEYLSNALFSKLKEFSNPPVDNILRQYADEFAKVLGLLYPSGQCDDKQTNELIVNLDEERMADYVSLATELTVAAHFAGKFPDRFRFHVVNEETRSKSGTPKNFDFAFSANEIEFSVEVKTFAGQRYATDNPVKLFLPVAQTKALYEQGARFSRNSAAALGKFLRDANSQLVRPSSGMSVLVLCCRDPDEYADALELLIGNNGIVKTSYTGAEHKDIDPSNKVPIVSDLPNVDAIVVCNVGLLHHVVTDTESLKFLLKSGDETISDGGFAWQYEPGLPIGFPLRPGDKNNFLLEAFGVAFGSHHVEMGDALLRNGGDIQAALFEMFNKRINL